jgi:diguanylate cyclase (GGDEF)-like protein
MKTSELRSRRRSEPVIPNETRPVMKLTSERLGIGAAIFTAGALVLVAAAGDGARRSYIASVAELEATHATIDEIRQSLLAISEAESTARGYVLSGDDELVPYYEACRPRFECSAARLSRLVHDDPERRSSADAFFADARERLALLDELVALRRRGDAGRVDELIASQRGRVAMERFRESGARLSDFEKARLHRQSDEAAAASRGAEHLVVVTFAVFVCAIATVFVLIRRDLRRRAKAADYLRDLSFTDPLTRLANRRAFDERLAGAVDRLPRSGSGFTLVVGDIDRFKRVNDEFGHTLGDDVLRWTADRLRDLVREGDFVARLGGEEFGLILDGLDRDEAKEVVERIRARFAEQPFLGRDAEGSPVLLRITLSFGVVIANTEDAGLEAAAAYARADAALYAAKRAGRNRTEFATNGARRPLERRERRGDPTPLSPEPLPTTPTKP